ncbi:MAG: TolC family outer membrane protein [Pseudomonadota bacterium]|nr:TolC family outer membrane protein [Pseudomonadota bacterium]
MNIHRTVAVSLLALSAGGLPLAQAETLSDAVSAALATNPGLQAQRVETEIAVETVEQARAQGRTTLDLSGSAGYEYIDSNAAFADLSGTNGDRPIASAQIQAAKPIYTGGRIRAGIRQARAGVDAAESQYDAAVQDLVLQVITAYVDVRSDLEAVAIRENNVEVTGEQVRAASDRFDVGVVTRTDVSLSQARLEGARAALAGAQATLEADIANYQFLTGLTPTDLAPPPPLPPLPESLEAAVQIALDTNPDLAAARHAERAAREAIEVARGQYKPQISIVGTAARQETYNDFTQRDSSVSAVAQGTIPLLSGGLIQSQVKSAKLQRAQAQRQIDTLQRSIRAQIAQSWFGYEASLRSIAASERQVEAARIAYDGAKEELAVGIRTTLDVLDQEQQLFEAQLALVQAERDSYVAAHSLLRATGQLSPDMLLLDGAGGDSR